MTCPAVLVQGPDNSIQCQHPIEHKGLHAAQDEYGIVRWDELYVCREWSQQFLCEIEEPGYGHGV